MISTISIQTPSNKEIIINDDFFDVEYLVESVTTLLFASGYTLQAIKRGYETELNRVKEYIQREIEEERQTTENN